MKSTVGKGNNQGAPVCESSTVRVNVVGLLSPEKLDELRKTLSLDGAWAIVLLPCCSTNGVGEKVIDSVVDIRFFEDEQAERRKLSSGQVFIDEFRGVSEALQDFREHILGGHSGGRGLPSRCPLTIRQRAILKSISQAKSNKEIAAEMGLSSETVKSHMRDIFRRLNVKNRMQAAQMYRSVMQKLDAVGK